MKLSSVSDPDSSPLELALVELKQMREALHFQEQRLMAMESALHRVTSGSDFLPCPFCGSQPFVSCDDYSAKASQEYYVECSTDDCVMSEVSNPDYNELKRRWNTRR